MAAWMDTLFPCPGDRAGLPFNRKYFLGSQFSTAPQTAGVLDACVEAIAMVASHVQNLVQAIATLTHRCL